MPDRIETEAFRDAGISQVLPMTAISPEGKMSCLDPSAAEPCRMTPLNRSHQLRAQSRASREGR